MENYDKFVKAFGGHPDFKNHTIEGTIITPLNKGPYGEVLNTPTDQFKGAYVYGNPGSGKTHIMKILFNHLYGRRLESINKRTGDFRHPYWINASDYLEQLRPGSGVSPQRLKDDVTGCDWLFIDDLGATTKTEWAVDQIFQLLDSRLRNKRQTFISSNFNTQELYEFYGERISSRVFELCQVIKLVGDDKRRLAK